MVLRVGISDEDEDNVFDSGELCDYHWWYQTDTGEWADKRGSSHSNLKGYTLNMDPTVFIWQSGSFRYDSSGKFYQINDIRTISW